VAMFVLMFVFVVATHLSFTSWFFLILEYKH
jgi:hypothetical protein